MLFDSMSDTPVIVDPIVMKLPKEGRLAAAPLAVGAASVFDPPAAIDPSEGSLFQTTGDSSLVIFLPATVRAAEPPRSVERGKLPIAPAALMGAAAFALTNFQRNRKISLFFCRSNREVGSVSSLESRGEHEEVCLLNTAMFGQWWPRLASANFLNPQENRPTFHLEEN